MLGEGRCKGTAQARNTTKMMKKTMRMRKILTMSQRLEVTDWKYLRISECAASTFSWASSTLASILRRGEGKQLSDRAPGLPHPPGLAPEDELQALGVAEMKLAPRAHMGELQMATQFCVGSWFQASGMEDEPPIRAAGK